MKRILASFALVISLLVGSTAGVAAPSYADWPHCC